MWLVLLLVVIASAHDHHGNSHDHHGHSHDHHGHAHDHHGHAHGNLGEAPNFKWSKQANTDENAHSHDPPAPSPEKKSTKDHSHDNHGHSHENNVHSQENHGHSHDNHGNSRESHGHSHGEEKDHKETFTPPKKAAVLWFEPLLATAAISMAPFLILFLVPLDSNSEENKPFLKILLAFASGGLLGDAFLHLIPHAVSPHSHGGDDHGHSHQHHHEDHGHDHSADMMVGLWVLTGLIVFLVVEKLVRHLKGGHGHSHGPKVRDDSDKKDKKEEKKDAKKENGKDSKENEDKDCDSTDKEENIKVAAYLNLAADFMHNFTDGLAIGVSFLVSRNVGLITSLTIFLHEIPHEIGDFAILIQSGCTKRKAMMLQLVTAVGAFAGCICGLLAEGLGAAASGWILPFTAGGFIYIATVSVIPELLEESRLTQSIKEITALLVGVFLMVIIATME